MKNQENTIFFINYNKNIRTETETLREGGDHWSILLYNKKINKFFHHDPIANTNKEYAVLMAQKLKNIDNKINPIVIEVLSPQQKNGFDCGIYALLYIKKIIEKIRKGTSPNRYENNEINSKDAEELRRNLYRQIAYELKDEENNGNKAKNTGKSNSESHKNVKTQKYSKIIDENDKNKKILEDKKNEDQNPQ